ncbi:helix-turn-helix domain-containing protein [Halodesulfurarchaeum sp. HSR-GB]|uniref:TrmB family transcriptional regulator n=1 Tax=Halodesulfurarchaeum sp. HSR-GB TaxID=3074077 RepID=UPI00285DA138|nr:helix-turn-helix domain-containing protein [Halodesulfurarchaeum sp. HSR-GB]MDR5657365.1 helix-turn-helix domain-containing protein [Halodesulfurarchaeum sp. HSR-GB]
MDEPDPEWLLERLDLGEYEVRALTELLTIGRTTAPTLSEATGIPKARIYDVLSELSDRGFLKVIPGRPKEYQPKPPAEILDRAIENRRQTFESERQSIQSMREAFLETFQSRFEAASQDITPTEELFWVVDVGEVSERETRQLYAAAEERIRVFTKSFEYLPAVKEALSAAADRGVDVRVLFVHEEYLEPDNQAVQAERMDTLDAIAGVDYRISESKLPVRGTLADPSMEYESGKALFLVEEEDIPLALRQAAVTENASFVAGMNRLFELTWEYESLEG